MLGISGALRFAKVFETTERPHLRVTREFCARERHRSAQCSACIDACPASALSFSDGLRVNLGLCERCGICGVVCPTAAIEDATPAQDEVTRAFEKAARESGRINLVCRRVAEREQITSGLPLECLGRVDASMLLMAALAGVAEIYLATGPCAGCKLSQAERFVDSAVSWFREFTIAAELAVKVTTGPASAQTRQIAEPAHGPNISRRVLLDQLLKRLGEFGAAEVSALLPAASKQESLRKPGMDLRHCAPRKKILLLQLLQAVKERNPAADQAHLPQNFYRPHIDEHACSGCRMCAFFCPTGALSKTAEDKPALNFDPSRCGGCGVCADICYRDAISIEPEQRADRVLNAQREEWALPLFRKVSLGGTLTY